MRFQRKNYPLLVSHREWFIVSVLYGFMKWACLKKGILPQNSILHNMELLEIRVPLIIPFLGRAAKLKHHVGIPAGIHMNSGSILTSDGYREIAQFLMVKG